MKIEINNKAKNKLDLTLIKRTVTEFARVYKIKHKEISIAFVGDAEIKKLNKTYRKKDEPTDILSFQGEGEILGELVIDYNQIKRQAGQFGNSEKAELIFILVHGLLHLLGHNDENVKDRQKMIKLGEEFIKNFRMTNSQ